MAITILNQAYLRVCPVKADLMDDDWNYIIHTFNMNFTEESFRNSYQKLKQDHVDDDVLEELGYD